MVFFILQSRRQGDWQVKPLVQIQLWAKLPKKPAFISLRGNTHTFFAHKLACSTEAVFSLVCNLNRQKSIQMLGWLCPKSESVPKRCSCFFFCHVLLYITVSDHHHCFTDGDSNSAEATEISTSVLFTAIQSVWNLSTVSIS